jgi:peptidoglycan/LPS O-acetylase OafA/YrhL
MPEAGPGASHALPSWRERFVRFVRGRSLAECIDSRRDNILLLRLIAALMVVVGHSFPLARPTSWPDDPMRHLLPRTASHLVGLMTFFMISGFLITLSFLRKPELLRFLRARFLRIWPALAVCVLAWAFVLGPLVSSLPWTDYFALGRTDDSPYAYAWGGLSIFRLHMHLPGVFAANPIPNIVNSSLWTIPVEASLYLWVAGAGVLRVLRFPWLASLAIAALFATLFGIAWTQGQSYTRLLPLVVQGFFGAGCIACLLRRHVPVSTGLMIAIAIACFLARKTDYETPFTWLAVGYFALWFSYVPRLPRIPLDFDLSYGVYLWAYPVQQTIVALGVREPVVLIATATPIILAIAAMSWLVIERPALRLKDLRWYRSATEPA